MIVYKLSMAMEGWMTKAPNISQMDNSSDMQSIPYNICKLKSTSSCKKSFLKVSGSFVVTV
jgi:hypothetical protein